MCVAIRDYYIKWTKDDDADEGGDDGDTPYNYDPHDPQDYWKKEKKPFA